MSGGSNIRRSPRYRVVVPAHYQPTSKGALAGKEGSGWTRNLSETGGCLELTEAFAPGTLLGVVLLDEEARLPLDAKVVWVGHPRLPSGGILHGVNFPQIAPEQRQALQSIIRRKRRQRSKTTRIPVALPAQCRSIGASSTTVRGWTGDLSQGGCLLLLPDRLSVGTLIELTLTMEAPPSIPSTFTTEGIDSATMEIAIGGREADGGMSARDVGRQRARRVLPRADGAPPTTG